MTTTKVDASKKRCGIAAMGDRETPGHLRWMPCTHTPGHLGCCYHDPAVAAADALTLTPSRAR